MLRVVPYGSIRWDLWEGVCRISDSFVGGPGSLRRKGLGDGHGTQWLVAKSVSYQLSLTSCYIWISENFEVWINFAHLNSPKLPTLLQTKGRCSYFVQRYLQYLYTVFMRHFLRSSQMNILIPSAVNMS
jgi:hypothetical protein